MSKIIAISNPKGGVGKTTTVINLAASLAIAEKKVLVIDIDPAGAVSAGLGLEREDIRAGMFEVFSGSSSFIEAIHQVKFTPAIDIVPANVFDGVEEVRFADLAKNRIRLKLLLNGLMESKRIDYDFILIDTPPVLNDLTLSAMLAADSVLIPMQCSFYAINTVERLLKLIDRVRKTTNTALEIEGVLITFFEKGTRATLETVSRARQKFAGVLLKSIIPKNAAIAYAAFERRPVALVDISATGAHAYLALAEEIISHENEKSKNFSSNDKETIMFYS